MSDYDKAALAKSRSIIMRRLDMHRLPYDCARCEFEPRCVSLAPARRVMCELDDSSAGVTLPEPKQEDYERCVEENADYYLQVHVMRA